MVRFTTATSPLVMRFEFSPLATHVYVPAPDAQDRDLPAAVAAAPLVAEIERTWDALNVNVHCTAAGSLPAGDESWRLKDAAPAEVAVPEVSVSDPLCANAEVAAKDRP